MIATATWDVIARCEPLLAALDRLTDQALRAVPDEDRHWCANAWFGNNVRPFIQTLVGWERGHGDQAQDPDRSAWWGPTDFSTLLDQLRARPEPENAFEEMLRGSDAYDVVYRRFYEKLPACRACGCISREALGVPRPRVEPE